MPNFKYSEQRKASSQLAMQQVWTGLCECLREGSNSNDEGALTTGPCASLREGSNNKNYEPCHSEARGICLSNEEILRFTLNGAKRPHSLPRTRREPRGANAFAKGVMTKLRNLSILCKDSSF